MKVLRVYRSKEQAKKTFGQSLKDAGFKIKHKEKIKLFGLPGEIVIGVSLS